MYAIEITTHDVTYRADRCQTPEDCGPGCQDSECTWLDGDSRSLSDPETDTIELDSWDVSEDGSYVDAAIRHISDTNAYQPSSYPIGRELPEHAWLFGSYDHTYGNGAHVTETSIRLIGDWTTRERAMIFSRVYDLIYGKVNA